MASQFEAVSSSNIVSVLPNLAADTIIAVLAKLAEDGVQTVEDLHYVQQQDLIPLLKPIQARKLRDSWSKTQTRVPVTPLSVDRGNVEVSPASSLVSPSHRLLAEVPLPWNKMPPALLTALRNKVQPNPALRREMVRIVSAEVHAINSHPGRRQLRVLAERIVKEYPDSFCDRMDDVLVGSGHDSLVFQFEERLNNMNRGKSSVRKRLGNAPESSSSASVSTTSTAKKPCFQDRYGCVSWQPPVPADGQQEDLRDKQKALQTLALSVDPDKRTIENLMSETYCLQRSDINSGHDALVLREMWPFLFTEIGIMRHVKLLTDIDLESVMMAAFIQKAPALISFCQSNKRVATVCQRLKEAKDELKNETPVFFGVVLLLMAYFNETEDSLILVKDVATAVPDDIGGLPATPCLVVFGRSAMTGSRFCLCVNGVVVCDNITNPSTAVAMLFGVFYVLNLHYPDGASMTLEFIQRCFARINPQRGTKAARRSGKKQHSIHPKILSLTTALRDFTNQWAL